MKPEENSEKKDDLVLEVKNLTKHFGGLTAVDRMDFSISKGEILGIIGPNGAGKTTLFNLITCVYKPTHGAIFFQGGNITGEKTYQVCHAGVGRTFQVVKFFGDLSVLDNVVVAAFCHINRKEEARQAASRILEEVGLSAKQNLMPHNLTIADKKRLELAKALATRPKLLLLDEIMAGLNPTEMDQTIGLIKSLQNQGYTVIVVEHVMRAIMALSNRIVVLNFGKKIAEGSPGEITRNPDVIKAYLGEHYAASRAKSA